MMTQALLPPSPSWEAPGVGHVSPRRVELTARTPTPPFKRRGF